MHIAGIERLQQAYQTLVQAGDAPPQTVLLSAASDLWSAMFDLHTWPTELRTKGVELQAILFRYGPIGMTIEQMVESERLQLRREMLAFLDRARQLDGEARTGDIVPS